MNRIATVGLIDPDHNQPSARRRPADHLIRLASRQIGLNPVGVVERLFNFRMRDMPFGMIGA